MTHCEKSSQKDLDLRLEEKSALKSKKFVAFLVSQMGFFVLMAIMLFRQEVGEIGENVLFMVLAVTSGVLASFYIGGQALVDKYVRVAVIMAGRDASKQNDVQAH